MKCAVIGMNSQKARQAFAREFGIDNSKPDFVVSYGGDGTLLYAEREYPGIPKLAVRDKGKCLHCARGTVHFANGGRVYCGSCLDLIIEKLKAGKFRIEKFRKIAATAFTNGRQETLEGLNEVQIHSNNHIHAVRFDLFVDGRLREKEAIGDGLVAATAFGSSAYFYAIARRKFAKGFGLAFNNTIRRIKPILLKDGFVAEAHIHRRHAVLLADNNPRMIPLEAGDRVRMAPSKNCARIIRLE